MNDEVTVLIPLHRSASNLAVVDGNLARLAPHHRVLVSDATVEDDTLERLRERWAVDPHIEFIGERPIARGWVAHYDDLLARCTTPMFMWLAHDDEIDADYVDACLDALRSTPDAAGAFGRIESINGHGLDDVAHPVCPDRIIGGDPLAAVDIARRWNLGIPFRGVFRRDRVVPIRPTTVDDEWADLVWVFGRLVGAPVVSAPDAIYGKRHHAGSTHAAWRNERWVQIIAPFLVDELESVDDAEQRRRAIRAIAEWAGDDVVGRLDELRHQESLVRERMDLLDEMLAIRLDELERLRSEVRALGLLVAELGDDRDDARRAIAGIHASRSWKLAMAVAAVGRVPARFADRFRRR